MNWCDIQLLGKRYSKKPMFRRAQRISSLGPTHCSCYDNRADLDVASHVILNVFCGYVAVTASQDMDASGILVF